MRILAVAAIVALDIPLALGGCTARPTTQAAKAGDVDVAANDTTCATTTDTATPGSVTFQITNGGQRVMEFYVYAAGDRVLGEVENVAPGQSRRLIVAMNDPGAYQVSCRPGMSGSGIRQPFTVTGEALPTPGGGPLFAAADGYKRYLISQVEALRDTTTPFVAAIEAGDVAAARRQYATTRTYYERIEPVAESFPDDLDPRLDLREADLQPGATWTGFHRLEKDLWTTGLTPDTAKVTDRLGADVDELAARVKSPEFSVDAVHIAGGAQTLLDEIARTKITGEEDIFSHTDLWDFQANVDGSQAALASVRPILDARNPDLGQQIDRRFAELDSELARFRTPDGYVGYDTVELAHRTVLSQRIDALSAVVSQVQPVIALR